MHLGGGVKTSRALEARGGSAHLALFERTWGPYAYADLGLALDGASSWSRWRRPLSMGIRVEPEREYRLVGAGAGADKA